VVLGRVNSHLEVSVADTGEGIGPDFLPFVFDRFRQADATASRRHGGLGIGLAIVKQLVELHGGRVRVASEGVGKGSVFTVELPTAIARSPSSPEPIGRRHPTASHDVAPPVAGDEPDLTGVSIVAVDDEPDARALVQRLLEDRGATVRVAASASEALDLIVRSPPDVLVSDIGMPGEDGYAFIRRVRSLAAREGGDVPAVALTAYARTEDRVQAIRAGYQSHVVKPVDARELVAVVSSLGRRLTPV
jgi:CheY-like chemotaxis protein